MVNISNNVFKERNNELQWQAGKKTIFTRKYTLLDAAQLWIQSKKNYWKPGTYTIYSQLLNKYILPYLGNIRIHKITNETMDNFVAHLMEQPQGKPLSRNYISQICGMVRRILSYMNRQYHCQIPVPCNPIPKGCSHPIILPGDNSLGVLEKYLFAHCEEDTCLGILVAFHTGIRIGELSALTWNDIDMEEELIYISKNLQRVKDKTPEHTPGGKTTQIVKQSPKTSDSFRVIPIPSILMPYLQKYRKKDSVYIISGTHKPWAEPRTIQYRFKSILKKCNIGYFNFHMLRHAFATRCIAMGLDVKSLSEILGHSNIQITLNLYVHSTTQQKKQLMKQYDALLQYDF